MKKFTKLLILGFFMYSILYSCIPTPYPAITTLPVTNITDTTCTSGGNIGDEGLSPITTRGVCWSTEPDPDINDYKTSDGSGNGTFTSSMTGLTRATTYYVRAYAINKDQTGYGSEIRFTTSFH